MTKMRENNPNKEGAAQGGGSPRPVRGRAPTGALGLGLGLGLGSRLKLGLESGSGHPYTYTLTYTSPSPYPYPYPQPGKNLVKAAACSTPGASSAVLASSAAPGSLTKANSLGGSSQTSGNLSLARRPLRRADEPETSPTVRSNGASTARTLTLAPKP